MIEIRGISIAYYTSGKVIKITTRGERGDDYKTFIFPAGKQLTKGTILTYLAKELKVKPKDIRIAEHIEIPK